MRYRTARPLPLLLGVFIGCLLCACSNSNDANYAEIVTDNEDNGYHVTSNTEDHNGTSSKAIDYLPLDDSEYSYAGIPRIVIETEKHQKIIDRESEIPAKLQIWGENAPKSEVMDLTIRGRGNTSWGMPKKSYKIEFFEKQEMLGMPKNRDWALIANYADKTLIKNYLAYHLSAKLGANYSPRCQFAELYLNKEYLGIYLVTETIKLAKNRVNIPNNENSYLIEIAQNHRADEQIIYSNILTSDSVGKPFRIHEPKNASKESLSAITEYIHDFEKFLKTIVPQKDNEVHKWIDINEFIIHYWIQEFSKNPDAMGWSSLFFTWEKGNVIKMGPVWDFDLAFGGHSHEPYNNPETWLTRTGYWYRYLFIDSTLKAARDVFWVNNKQKFFESLDIVDTIQAQLQHAIKNNFKRWDVLQSTELNYHLRKYDSYNDAVNELKNWIKQRFQWIEKQQ